MSVISLSYHSRNIPFSRMGIKRGIVCDCLYSSFDTRFGIPRKEEQPRFKSRLCLNHWMIFADFDTLPSGFEDWDGFGMFLRSFNVGCVIDTMSSKKKLVLHVDSDAMTNGIAYNTFRKYLGDLVDYCDRSAFLHSYIMPSQFETISDYLNNTAPVKAVRDSLDWNMINIPDFDGVTGTTRKVLQFFTSCSLDTIDGSQKYMAELFNVNQSTICQSIRRLISMRFIELSDSSYRVGIKAKSYRLVNKVCIRVRDISKVMKATYTVKLSEIPSEIEDGTWFSTIWASTRFFNNGIQFVSWISKLSGINMRGRYKRCIQAWNAHALKNRLPLVELGV